MKRKGESRLEYNARTMKEHAKPFKAGGAAPKGKYIGQTKKVTTPKGSGNRERA